MQKAYTSVTTVETSNMKRFDLFRKNVAMAETPKTAIPETNSTKSRTASGPIRNECRNRTVITNGDTGTSIHATKPRLVNTSRKIRNDV